MDYIVKMNERSRNMTRVKIIVDFWLFCFVVSLFLLAESCKKNPQPCLTCPADTSSIDSSRACQGPFGQWQSLGLGGESIISAAISPDDPRVIYAGSAWNFSDGIQGKLFKSTNCGQTWDTLLVGGYFSSIEIDPTNPSVVYATPYGIVKSLDRGKTWQDMSSGIFLDGETLVASFAMNPMNTSVLYAGTGGPFGGKVYRSSDGGANWISITTNDTLLNGVVSLAIDPKNPNIIFAGTSQSGDVLRSDDGGAYWKVTTLNSTGSIVDEIAINPSLPNVTYAGVRFLGFFKTTDGGDSWSLLQSNFSGSSFSTKKLLIDQVSLFTIYATISGSAHKSTNGGDFWTPLTIDTTVNKQQVLLIDSIGTRIIGSVNQGGISSFKIN